MSKQLWKPSDARKAGSLMTDFTSWLERQIGLDFPDYAALHAWSVEHIEAFWASFMVYTGLRHSGSYTQVLDTHRMPGAKWFEGMRLNYAENCLERKFYGPAVVYRIEQDGYDSGEAGYTGTISFQELKQQVSRCARGLKVAGVRRGDRVGGYVANVPEAIIAALACAAVGATWSSASPDFGLQALVDRFGQVEPRLVFASTHYRYKGKTFRTDAVVEQLKSHISSIETIVSIPYPIGEANPGGDVAWDDFLDADDAPTLVYEQVPFDHPLYILFSSGTTGAPKCMVHGTGGTLLQHRKELQLHTDLHPGDRLLYFTTCGWMMWNWQLSALSVGATVVLYDGNPAHPDLSALWRVVNELEVTHFGTSGRHIESCMKSLPEEAAQALNGLPHIRSILYTGSPLSENGYEWVYDTIKPDVHLAGISGGTDIVSCFMLGNPNLPVYSGEIQCKGLGVDIVALDDEGRPVEGEPGELVCRQPLPCMPVRFLNDPDGSRYHDAYFDVYPGLWRHGDFVTITEHGGVIVHGRSDATLNPAGVRIGSAEIYAALDVLDFITGAVAVGWVPPGQSDEQIVLLVTLAGGVELDEEHKQLIRQAIRTTCSPRHVPRQIFSISEIPVTRSGKTVELSVKAILAGREVKNRHALANPHVLEEIGVIRERMSAGGGN